MSTALTAEEQYLNILKELLELAEKSSATPDRTGTGRVRVFGRDIRCDLLNGQLPIITTRKIRVEHGIDELLWLIRGSTNINDLPERTRVIWKGWAIEEKHVDATIQKFFPEIEEEAKRNLREDLIKKHVGSIGPMYGQFWRENPVFNQTALLPLDSLNTDDIPSDKLKRFNEEYDEILFFHQTSGGTKEDEKIPSRETYVKVRYFESVDQLGEIIRGIKNNPYSARHIVSVWIPQALPYEKVLSPHENVLIGRGALAACHAFFQFFVEKADDGGPDYLSLRLTQRSCDIILGVPTNLNEYACLTHLVAHCTGLRAKEFIWSGGDVHIYKNHIEDAKELLKRDPYPAPTIKINPDVKDLFAITSSDIEVQNYQHHPFVRFEVSI